MFAIYHGINDVTFIELTSFFSCILCGCNEGHTLSINTLPLHDILIEIQNNVPRPGGLLVSVSASYAVGLGFEPGHTKDHHGNGTNCLLACYACVRVGV